MRLDQEEFLVRQQFGADRERVVVGEVVVGIARNVASVESKLEMTGGEAAAVAVLEHLPLNAKTEANRQLRFGGTARTVTDHAGDGETIDAVGRLDLSPQDEIIRV